MKPSMQEAGKPGIILETTKLCNELDIVQTGLHMMMGRRQVAHRLLQTAPREKATPEEKAKAALEYSDFSEAASALDRQLITGAGETYEKRQLASRAIITDREQLALTGAAITTLLEHSLIDDATRLKASVLHVSEQFNQLIADQGIQLNQPQ